MDLNINKLIIANYLKANIRIVDRQGDEAFIVLDYPTETSKITTRELDTLSYPNNWGDIMDVWGKLRMSFTRFKRMPYYHRNPKKAKKLDWLYNEVKESITEGSINETVAKMAELITVLLNFMKYG